ncbi:hypothetical protein ACFX10_016984 [Malus domestica]
MKFLKSFLLFFLLSIKFSQETLNSTSCRGCDLEYPENTDTRFKELEDEMGFGDSGLGVCGESGAKGLRESLGIDLVLDLGLNLRVEWERRRISIKGLVSGLNSGFRLNGGVGENGGGVQGFGE